MLRATNLRQSREFYTTAVGDVGDIQKVCAILMYTKHHCPNSALQTILIGYSAVVYRQLKAARMLSHLNNQGTCGEEIIGKAHKGCQSYQSQKSAGNLGGNLCPILRRLNNMRRWLQKMKTVAALSTLRRLPFGASAVHCSGITQGTFTTVQYDTVVKVKTSKSLISCFSTRTRIMFKTYDLSSGQTHFAINEHSHSATLVETELYFLYNVKKYEIEVKMFSYIGWINGAQNRLCFEL